ncbi:xylanase inhibitor protein 1-like [Phragmites australis]|uniref:xylanase inhibitor protein 1-like n=1 Tax=Phragmites australis TaxID=29695 RepID=UPI002D7772EF|nr:xylanase inhibitor protein 1-like [Phragmites australis]
MDMAFRRRSSAIALLFLALVLSFLAGPATARKTGQLTVFWGRNKYEGSLREACDTGLYTTVIMSFFNVFGHGRYWTDLSGHPVPGVGNDIKHCQSRHITVLLSIGGGGDGYSLPSSRSAADVADHLWNVYLGGRRNGVFRPFGDAVVDGIDFFIDRGAPDHYDELARNLNRYSGRGKKVHLTATPRCAFPDWHVERALATGLFERLHVRFYDDARCSYNRAGLRGVIEEWSKWTARYPRSQVYLGLAAANVPGKYGDKVSLEALYYDLLPNVQKAGNYGGIMLWDRFYDKQTRYGAAVKYWA